MKRLNLTGKILLDLIGLILLFASYLHFGYNANTIVSVRSASIR